MKLAEIASRLGLELRGSGGIDILVPAPIEAAAPGTIVFVANEKYASALEGASASAAIVTAELAARAKCAVLVSANPYYDFSRVLELFFPPYRPAAGVDASARIAPDAKIGEGASIGAFSSIGAGARIGARAVIHPHVTIYPNVTIGDDFVCHSQVSIREGVSIGNRVTILNGAVIGADGFGFGEHAGGLFKIPQVGTVVIEDDVEIGANSTVDRAMMGATTLHRGVKLDNLVHVGHNNDIGQFSRFSAQVGLSGSVKVGQWCLFGGQVGVADHVEIGDRVWAAGQAGIPNDVGSDTIVGGTPAVEVRAWRRNSAALSRLPDLLRRVRQLERRIEALDAPDSIGKDPMPEK
ncbi:MAG TPA: UDP-3-O-(3-hydroxymyristoyl)glucosamine N-acyltransferase [Candidatus Binataceae bacterium]|nr:UDP-3-O-(3-hydroxymyristoyl)glucosamine N-acyltransferase [Candidatus Binataceae bacterium]